MKNSVSERSFLIESDEEEDASAAVEDGKRRRGHGEESDDEGGSDSSSPCDSPRVVAAQCSRQPSSYTQQWPQSYK